MNNLVLKKNDFIIMALLCLFFVLLYSLTAVRGVYSGDSGEILAAANSLGLAHPTGFPLYLVSGKLFSLLFPIGEFAFRLNIFSAVLTALSVGIFFLILRQLDILRTASFFSSAILGLGQSIWSTAVSARVYSLSLFLVLVLIYIFVLWVQNRKPFLVYLYSFILGLSFGTHVLMLPLIIPLILMAKGSAGKINYVKTFLLFFLPFAQYLYLPWAYGRNPVVNWGDISSFANFLDYITQREYAHKIFARSSSETIQFAKQASILLFKEFTHIFFILGISGLFILK